jgi:vancomycin resistance protein YoaR
MLASLAGAAGAIVHTRQRPVPLARFATPLKHRTPNQVHNVALALTRMTGRTLAPGEVFSFNQAAGSWNSRSGYRRAPVSYDGELIPSWGGGVCQASTTLYNAALLAGLTIVERHRHHWLAGYVAPGRDAAVADPDLDLRFRNDHPWPICIEGEIRGELVEFRILGPEPTGKMYDIEQKVQSTVGPTTIAQPWRPGFPARRVRNPGKAGCRVVTYRVATRGGRRISRELLSDDNYPAMNRLILEP